MDLTHSCVEILGPKASGCVFPVAHYTFRTMQVTNYYPQQQQQQQQLSHCARHKAQREGWNGTEVEKNQSLRQRSKRTTLLGNKWRGIQRKGVWHRNHFTSMNIKVFGKQRSYKHAQSLECEL
jgi:hypothetical protein